MIATATMGRTCQSFASINLSPPLSRRQLKGQIANEVAKSTADLLRLSAQAEQIKTGNSVLTAEPIGKAS